MTVSSLNRYLICVVFCLFILLKFEAKSDAVAIASKSRRLSKINEYVRAENTSVPSPPTHRKSNTQKKLRVWALGFFLGAIAGIITGVIISILYKVIATIRGRRKRISPTIFSPLIKKPELLSFLESEDEVKSLEIVGEGACGVVYKAPLQSGEGKLLAIKKIEVSATNLDKNEIQMRSEIETAGRVRHKNIVPLLAHVAGNGSHYLVYEFMKNGSLQAALKDSTSGKRELTWRERKNIAVGISLGLEYIHSHQRPRIFHRDLKPANILLDEEMEARIADFGLAKIVADGLTHGTSSHVGGTFGYMDTEYARTLRFTEKSDIYSFGMIMGALVTGKEPDDPFYQTTDELTMVKWIRNMNNSGNPSNAIDEKLLGKGFEKEILLLLEVACMCTQEDSTQRPNAVKAREMLSQI